MNLFLGKIWLNESAPFREELMDNPFKSRTYILRLAIDENKMALITREKLSLHEVGAKRHL